MLGLELGGNGLELDSEMSENRWSPYTFTNWENSKRYSQYITNSIWNLSPGYGILLDMVEGSGKVPFWY